LVTLYIYEILFVAVKVVSWLHPSQDRVACAK